MSIQKVVLANLSQANFDLIMESPLQLVKQFFSQTSTFQSILFAIFEDVFKEHVRKNEIKILQGNTAFQITVGTIRDFLARKDIDSEDNQTKMIIEKLKAHTRNAKGSQIGLRIRV